MKSSDDRGHLHDHPERVEIRGPGTVPSAEEERGAQAAEHDDVHVLGHEERAEAHSAVLGVVARDDLGIGLGQVERRARRLGEAGDEEDQEADELRHDEPDRVLVLDDLGQRQRARRHHDPEQRQAERDLVGDQLRGAPHRAEERVLRARRPAAEHEAVEGDRTEGEHVEDPDRDVDPVEAVVGAEDAVLARVAERDERERRDRGEHRDHRGQRHHPRHRGARLRVLLRQQLHHVRERLEQAVGADAVRPVARLHPAHELALDEQHDRRDGEDEARRSRGP